MERDDDGRAGERVGCATRRREALMLDVDLSSIGGEARRRTHQGLMFRLIFENSAMERFAREKRCANAGAQSKSLRWNLFHSIAFSLRAEADAPGASGRFAQTWLGPFFLIECGVNKRARNPSLNRTYVR